MESARCAHRLQTCSQVVECLPHFLLTKFSSPTPFFPSPSLENHRHPPRCKGEPRRGTKTKGCDTAEWRAGGAGKLSTAFLHHSFNFLIAKNYCKSGLRGNTCHHSKLRCFRAKSWLSCSRDQLHGVGGPGGSPSLSVNYYFFSLWGDSVCVFISGSTNYPFDFP